ncbi:MAG TPA: ABC transporter ATP-binding protein [bacterium]|nr:ABC transporter ATP-binding protein [bacterium]
MNNVTKLCISNIIKKYDSGCVVNNVSISVKKGEFFALLGPSGSGKTTLLRIIAGFVKPDSGRVMIENKDITDLPPNQRNTAMVFQNFSLWPHMNVFENVAFGLRLRKMPIHTIKEKVYNILSMVQLTDFVWKKPQYLSGGQQQRIALARALVIEPDILLLDEPLSNLDAHLRDELRQEIKALQKKLDITTVYVTHDQTEAILIADTIAIMMNGSIIETGSPENLYQNPQCIESARFLGKLNEIEGVIKNRENDYYMIETPIGLFRARASRHFAKDTQVIIGFRPEFLYPSSEKDQNNIECEIVSIEHVGTSINVGLKINNYVLKAVFAPLLFKKPSSEKFIVSINPDHILVFGKNK